MVSHRVKFHQQAINGSQLYQAANMINNNINRGLDKLNGRINDVDKNARAGIASGAAIAGIPQVYLPGKSGLGVGVGNHRGQSALAVGYSRTSDNSKHIIKLSAGMDSQSHGTLSAGYMYQW